MLVKLNLCFLLHLRNNLTVILKIKLNGKKLYEADSVRYLRTQIKKRLTGKRQINHLAIKLNKANPMLSKLRHVLDIKTLRLVYYAMLESRLCYTSLV